MVDHSDGEGGSAEGGGLTPRPPEQADLAELCRHLNETGALYLVIGGFAVIHAGYPRFTGDLDLLVETSPENEAKIIEALASLPDQAVLELEPGDIAKYTVVRVADEIMVDLMEAAGGIRYNDAVDEIITRDVDGVPVPFASPRLLWRMKKHTYRQKDALDILFLQKYFAEMGEDPPQD